MPYCVAWECNNTTKPGINQVPAGVQFHRFPKKLSLWEIWVTKVNRLNWNPKFGSDYRLCSEHRISHYCSSFQCPTENTLVDNTVPDTQNAGHSDAGHLKQDTQTASFACRYSPVQQIREEKNRLVYTVILMLWMQLGSRNANRASPRKSPSNKRETTKETIGTH